MKVRYASKAVLLALLASGLVHAQAGAQSVFLHIEAQPVRSALQQFGRQTSLDVLIRLHGGTLDELRTAAVEGNFTAVAALERLLAPTGLEYEFVNPRTVAVRFPTHSASLGDASARGLRLAQAEGPSVSAGGEARPDILAEIVVTAQKKSERLQDVPVPVSVTNPQDLILNNQTKLLDYYSKVPGLTLTPVGFGNSMVSIRGITTGQNAFENPSVSFIVDDVPYGSSNAAGGGVVVPDINPDDLARIEVLRGPQGTLYGASSIGGTIKYVTVEPDPTRLSGHIQTGLSGIKNGDGLGNNIRGSINIPINDRSAVRASAYYQLDPGYVDNPVSNLRGVNRQTSYGGRIAGLWNITDDVTAKLGATVQRFQADGASDLNLSLGDLKQNYLKGSNTMARNYQVYSAEVDAKLGGGATLKSITAYSRNKESASVDLSVYFSGLAMDAFGVGGVPLTNIFDSAKFSQELRMEMPLTSNLEWLVGAFYTHERTPYLQQDLAADETTGKIVGVGSNFDVRTEYSGYAAFTDLTWRITDKFDVQVGGRESYDRQRTEEVDSGVFLPALFGITSEYQDNGAVHSSDNAFTYVLTPRLHLSDEIMVYARVASGFRAGGTNSATPPQFHIPNSYSPDRTENYEIGLKGSWLDGRLFVDASLFDIEWKKIQLTVNLQSYQPFVNGSGARSRGAELSVNYKPVHGLTLSGWVDYDDAKVTKDFPAESTVAVFQGDRLPYSAKLSGYLSAENDFDIAPNVQGFVGGSFNYVGKRMGNFLGTDLTRAEFPSYTKIDLHVGARFADWTANFFVNNVADKRGLIDKDPTIDYYYVIQPRTVGVNLSRSF